MGKGAVNIEGTSTCLINGSTFTGNTARYFDLLLNHL